MAHSAWAFALVLIAAQCFIRQAIASPITPRGPCPDAIVDAIFLGQLDPSVCCSYGHCKGDVVISVGD
ncbi:hypothetical protein NLU13_8083 [Sarocladium strictum]|uniref:Secreted protein n=1 Tax=Sarocladium strictum TaxID=5046 RepID=A0AA39GCE6_SARSR|nr:hypothetical protein NLU13_8083 [Sarocladium strictum]